MDLNKGCFLLSRSTVLYYTLDIMSNYFDMTTYHKWKERKDGLESLPGSGKEPMGHFKYQ